MPHKNNIQPTKFKSIGEFLDFIPEDEREIVEHLRSIVLKALPDCKEKLAYNVPFYYRHSRICYIWPASIPWGGIEVGVALGFCKGHLLSDEDNILEKGNRKEICTKTYSSMQEVDPDLLTAYLFEAREIDDPKSI